MIDKITVGSGNSRTSIEMVRDKQQRRSVAGAIKGFLFPTKEAHQAAMDQGRKNRDANPMNRMAFA